MAVLDEKIVKVIFPKSNEQPEFEQYEFMLAWIGRKGEPYQFLFENWSESIDTAILPVNVANSHNNRNVPLDELDSVTLFANDLTLNEVRVLHGIKVAKNIYRLFKDGTLEQLTISGQNTILDQQKNRYEFAVTVQLPRKVLQR